MMASLLGMSSSVIDIGQVSCGLVVIGLHSQIVELRVIQPGLRRCKERINHSLEDLRAGLRFVMVLFPIASKALLQLRVFHF